MIEDLCGIPVTGVVPYADVDIEDEDSLGHHLKGTGKGETTLVDIAVIRLPRISNFTDFQVFSCMPEVGLTYVERLSDLGKPDLIVLPGNEEYHRGFTLDRGEWPGGRSAEAGVCRRSCLRDLRRLSDAGESLEDPFGERRNGTGDGRWRGLSCFR